MDFAEKVYFATETLPRKEDYGLTSQIRRAALSVSANLAEGFGRNHSKDKLNFYYIARASLLETKNHLIYGNRVAYFTDSTLKDLFSLLDEIWIELNRLIKSLKVE